jgi:hypothetical protein
MATLTLPNESLLPSMFPACKLAPPAEPLHSQVPSLLVAVAVAPSLIVGVTSMFWSVLQLSPSCTT